MKKFSIFLVVMVVLVSCEKDPLQKDSQYHTEKIIYASTAMDSRTYFEFEENTYVHKWSADDMISVFDETTAVAEYLLIDGANTTQATFLQISMPSGGESLNNSYAVYPSSTDNTVPLNNVFRVSFPATQDYNFTHTQSYGIGSAMLVGIGTVGSYSFRNAGGFLEIQLLGEGITVKDIVLSGNKNERIAGNAIITYDGISEPKTTMLTSAITTITLDCDTGVQLHATNPTKFIFALPPTTFEEGFSVKINEISGRSLTMVTKKRIEVARNVVLPMQTLDYYSIPIMFTDEKFKQSVVELFDANGDGEISLKEALEINTLDISSKELTSLDGIEYFTNLQTLNCSNNKLVKLDLSGNAALKKVDMTGNANLTQLTVWRMMDYQRTYMDYDPSILETIGDKDGNKYGKPYELGQYIPLHSGGIVAFMNTTKVGLLSIVGYVVNYSERNSEEATLWRTSYGTDWAIPSYHMWGNVLRDNRVIIEASLATYGVGMRYINYVKMVKFFIGIAMEHMVQSQSLIIHPLIQLM